MIEQYSQQVKYKEPLLLFQNNRQGKLQNVSAASGPVFARTFPARGLAIGDYNNDGRIDVLIGNNGAAPMLLKNNAGEGHHWLGLRLQGTACNRDAIGAVLSWSVGGQKRTRFKTAAAATCRRTTRARCSAWARPRRSTGSRSSGRRRQGKVERFTNLPVDRYVTIVEREKGKPNRGDSASQIVRIVDSPIALDYLLLFSQTSTHAAIGPVVAMLPVTRSISPSPS